VNSLIFLGSIHHRHSGTRHHEFKYKTFMHYLDLDEIDNLFNDFWLWSSHKKNIAHFNRKNYLNKKNTPLKEEIKALIREKIGNEIDKAYLLTNLSYFGYCINPISLYFCFKNNELTHCVLEVTNTPWGEKQIYITQPEKIKGSVYKAAFNKEMHVSPFLAMEYEYHLKFKHTKEQIIVSLENWKNDKCHFDATLSLRSLPITKKTLSHILMMHPFITGKVYLAIRWEALKLWVKQFPIFDHPRRKRYD